MIKRLRKRFIRITTVSVAAVMILLMIIVNVANFVSVDSGLRNTLEVIAENRGTLPTRLGGDVPPDLPDDMMPPDGQPPEDGALPPDGQSSGDGTTAPGGTGMPPGGAFPPNGRDDQNGRRITPGAQLNEEALFSTRFFVLTYSADGTLQSVNLDRIAAVTEDETDGYLAIARAKGSGFGYTGNYRYYVTEAEDGTYMAVFLECYQELRSIRILALMSVIAAAVSIALVWLLVTLLSQKAIDPTIRAYEQQKQFITDASHELKTPLTVINTSLSVLEMETGQNKWIDKANAQTVKMAELINELVTLSRLDEEEPRLLMTDFAVSDAVSEVAESFRDAAEAAGHPLELAIEPGLRYRGDEAQIRRLASILLENALKYTAEGGTIRFSLAEDRHELILRESNPCQPIAKEDLDRLFERFYRPDKSRTSSTGGFGVGLSIARAIAEAHRGSIRAESPREGEIEFTAILK